LKKPTLVAKDKRWDWKKLFSRHLWFRKHPNQPPTNDAGVRLEKQRSEQAQKERDREAREAREEEEERQRRKDWKEWMMERQAKRHWSLIPRKPSQKGRTKPSKETGRRATDPNTSFWKTGRRG
jgi:hypothetical protein